MKRTPSRTEGSRIEEPKGPWKGFQDLPAWYHRLLHKVIDHDMKYAPIGYSEDPVRDSDFYEDLSDVDLGEAGKEDNEGKDEGTPGSASESQARDNCSCNGEDSECDCLEEEEEKEEEEYDWDYESESERSYDGSDADLYYELKERREELQKELAESREETRARQATQHKFELEKEREVRAVYSAFKKDRKKGTQFPLDIHKTSRSYELFSCDYVEHLWSDLQCTRRLDIEVFDERLLKTMTGKHNAELLGEVRGQIYLDGGTCCDFGPFEPPRFARRRTSTYKAERRYDVSIRFVGKRHVKVMLPRQFVSCDGSRPLSDSAPDVFTFYGILIDHEKRIADRKAARNRATSPGETIFDMDLDMGYC